MCHYITKFNRKRLFSLVPYKVLLGCRFEGEVYKGSTPFWLNKMEVAKLLAYRDYCKNPSQFLTRYKRYIDLNRNRQFSRFDVPPAYHNDSQCENLRSSYEYIEVPQEIREQGEDVINQYKEFVRKNYDLIECGKTDVLEYRINAKFHVETKLIIGRLPNSGITDVSFVIKEIEKEIDDTNIKLDEWSKADDRRKNIVIKFGRQAFNVKKEKHFIMDDCSDEFIREVLQEFNDNFKLPLIKLFNSYYEATSGEEKSAIEGDILDQLGFHPCSKCVPVNYDISEIFKIK